MSGELLLGEPGWLARGAAPLPFVLTLCAGGALQDALSRFAGIAGEDAMAQRREVTPEVAELELRCTPAEAWSLLRQAHESLPDIDAYIQPVDERGKRLLICDMDMTIVAVETLDEVAARLGLGAEISAITARAMHGEIDFNAALRERIGMLRGQSEQIFYEVAQQIVLNPGARRLLGGARAAGVHTILVSGGFVQVAEAVAKGLGFDELHCNRLEIDNGKLTGRVVDPIINADLKSGVLERRASELGIDLADCCAIGDGANDLPMLETAGLGIAYRGKPLLRAATACQINATDLSSALYFMGL